MKGDKTFNIIIDWKEFNDNRSILIPTIQYTKLKVLEKPYKKWWKVVLQYLSLWIYRAPWQYKVELIK